MRNLESFHCLIHEAKHEKVAVQSSREHILVIETCLDMPYATMVVIVHIKRPERAEVLKVVRSIERMDSKDSVIHSKKKEFTGVAITGKGKAVSINNCTI